MCWMIAAAKTRPAETQKNDLLRLVTRGLNRVERLILILYYYEEMTMKRSAPRSTSAKAA